MRHLLRRHKEGYGSYLKEGSRITCGFYPSNLRIFQAKHLYSAASEDAVEKWSQRMEEAELIMKEMERRLEEEEQQNKLLQAGLPTRWRKRQERNVHSSEVIDKIGNSQA